MESLNRCAIGVVVWVAWCAVSAPSRADELPCPAVDASGARPALTSPLIDDVTRPEDESIQNDLAEKAIEIVGLFEAGGGDPWSNVSNHERVSIGFMQWNWATQTMIKQVFAGVDPEAIAAAPQALRPDLEILKALADQPGSADKQQQAAAVIDAWTSARSGDPLQMGIRKSVRSGLQEWLNTPALKAVQRKLVDKQLAQAFALARAWRRDTAVDGVEKPIDARLVAYFFDLVTFNGGRKGLWVAHVRDYRARVGPGRKPTVEAVAAWLTSCAAFSNPNTQHRRLYNAEDGRRSAAYWTEKVSHDDAAFSEDQVDLLVFGLLRAQASNGDNKPRGFPGIYQADVLTRRGVIALGSGFIRGSQTPITLFE